MVSLSTAESEPYAAVKTASEGLGIQSVAKDLETACGLTGSAHLWLKKQLRPSLAGQVARKGRNLVAEGEDRPLPPSPCVLIHTHSPLRLVRVAPSGGSFVFSKGSGGMIRLKKSVFFLKIHRTMPKRPVSSFTTFS